MSFFLNTTVCGFSLYHILAFFLIYSCLGWCVEVVYAAATTGQLVNRGFLNGPVCPIYGFGMILVLFFLTPLEDDLLLLYLGGVILPSALELVGGWALYKLYRTRWWDYTDKPFNIGGYVCLEFSLMWGVGAMVMVKVIHPTIAALVNIIPPLVGFVLMCLLYAVYASDVVATAIAASDLARELDALEKVADSMHAVSDAMTEILGTTALDMDQKMDESRLQLKLAAAEPEARSFVRTFPDAYPAESALGTDDPEPGQVPRLYQWDSRWGSTVYSSTAFALTGCCPTSLSMVYQGLTGKGDLSPYDMGRRASEGGYETQFDGTDAAFLVNEAASLGLSCAALAADADSVRAALEGGAVLICNVGPGDFTDNGHFLVITGIDDEGNLAINDPYSAERSGRTWNVDTVLGQTKALWAYRLA